MTTTCDHCGAPCRKHVLMRGGDNGWGDDASRTVKRFNPPAPSMAERRARKLLEGKVAVTVGSDLHLVEMLLADLDAIRKFIPKPRDD